MNIELQYLNLVDGLEQWSIPNPISSDEMNQILHGAVDRWISNNTLKIQLTITISVPPRAIPTDAQIAEMESQRTSRVSRLFQSRKGGR